MATQALYRRWRPQTFEDVIGQDHVTQTLRNALATGRVAHAYLFAGPRGTGKTSVARILAKAVNCLAPEHQWPCNACHICRSINEGRCLDLIEIDAASNRGIDEIRDLREKVRFAPNEAKYKFYVIDECFRYEDLITLADGSKLPIGKIVEAGWHVKVLSYNERTHRIEPKPVVRHMRKRPELPVVRITFDNNRALVCTLNHKVYTPNGQMHAGELEVGQFVYAGCERITQHQLPVIAGAALGDGHIALTGSQMRACLPPTDDGALSGLAVNIVRSMERVAPPEFVYNIEVADNHNYFARDILVANCHMLTSEAFNALLKTLEEPPAHALFVLATTEPHKIPETILSRCQRFDFHRVPLAKIMGKLKQICAAESIDVEPEALEAIARAATGSFRDAESLLDQLFSYADDAITLAQVQRLLGTVSQQAVEELVDHLIDGDTAAGLQLINRTIDDGTDPRQFTRQLLEYLRGILLLQTGGEELINVTDSTLERMRDQVKALPTGQLVSIIRRFGEADFSLKIGAQPQLPLELAFVEVTLQPSLAETTTAPGPVPTREKISVAVHPERRSTGEPPRPSDSEPARRHEPRGESPRRAVPAEEMAHGSSEQALGQATKSEPALASPGHGVVSPVSVELADVQANWEELLTAIRPHSRTVEALLKDCKPITVAGDVVTLGFFYPFHKQRIEEPKNKGLVARMLERVLGSKVQVRCVMIDRDTAKEEIQRRRPKDQYQQAAEDPVIQAAIEKFGARIAGIESAPSTPEDK